MAEKNLEVKNLRISFRTNNGKVQAVRDISFDLERGRTMAIVGESGSGKSVTSRAIMGILAGNAIVEGGEILYDGKDLLKITEDDMYKIRGDKIAMIFQDPLSSLNPIVRIGKQITEAMLLKNKASRKESRTDFNTMMERLKKNMIAASGDEASVKKLTESFDKFSVQGNHLENNYNLSHNAAEDLAAKIKDFLFRMSKNQKLDVKACMKEYASDLKKIKDPYFVSKYADRLNAVGAKVTADASKCGKKMESLPENVAENLKALENLLDEMCQQVRPDFFSIGFYAMNHPGEKLYERDIEQLNKDSLAYLNENFLNSFIELGQKAVAYAHKAAYEKKQAVLDELKKAQAFFGGEFDNASALKYAEELAAKVEDSIDRMEIIKDSAAYTFRTALNGSINKYFYAVKNNPKEQARFERQTKKREALIAKGKKVDWKVIPAAIQDLEQLRSEILKPIIRLADRYENVPAEIDNKARAEEIIEYLKEKTSKAVYKVTQTMAKEKAIKLMEEVGIAEPRMRFYQYPFEFSGGMRQRIVIAIALSADPEILICDEPTTALDVTIQAQILELINKLKEERKLSVIFITHDLGVVANMADDIAVMYAGKIVEYGTADDIFYDPRHPYTWALLSSMPDLDTKEKLDAIPGTPPNMIYPPVGDAFAARNKYAMQIDFEQQPPMFKVSDTHSAATWLLHPDAPTVEMPRIISDRIARMKKAGGAQ